MAYEINNGQGAIFKNNKSSGNHPDYKGQLKTPDGQLLDIALWVKEGQKCKYFSVKVQEPYQGQQQSQGQPADDGDDLPF